MQFRRFLCMVFSCVIAVSCFGFNAKAVDVDVYEAYSVERASGRFSVDIPGNTLAVTSSDLPLEIGETVAINASYSPRSASVDGLSSGINHILLHGKNREIMQRK